MMRSAMLALVVIAGAVWFGMSPNTETASAAKACGKVEAATGGKARVAAYRTNCKKARQVAIGYYERQAIDPMDWDGVHPTFGIFYRVGGYRCFTGLGGSQASCVVGKRRVLASTRPEDRPAKWLRASETRSLAASCPSSSSIVRPRKLAAAARALRKKLGDSASGYSVQKLTRAANAPTSGLAEGRCGPSVLRKSVYVRLSPKGVQCSSCDTGFFMSKFPGSGWRIWFID